MKTLTLSLALLFATDIAAHAQQNDYIVNTKGDTVKCKINKPFLGGPRYTIGDFSDKITTSDVSAYYQSKEHAMVRAVCTGNSKRPTFMVVIEDGPITLYEDVNTYYNAGTGVSTSTRNWFWSEKSSNQAEPLKTSALSIGSKSREERMHDFAELLREKNEIYEAFISQKSFSFKQIQKLVHWYNTGEKELPEKYTDSPYGY